MTRLELTLLGGFSARLSSGLVLGLPTRKTQALLAYLALHPGQGHPRDKLASLLWGDMGQAEARRNLRRTLFSLRQAVGETGALVTDGSSVRLDPDGMGVDVREFERLVRAGSPATLEEGVRLYQGDLLAGVTLREAPFEEWLLAERERLRELAMEGLAKVLAHQRAAGAIADAIETGLRLIALDPLQEPVHRTLMRLYAQAGRRAAALRQYQSCVSAVARELRAEPEPETRALYQELLRERRARGEAPAAEHPRPAAPASSATGGQRTEIPLVGRLSEMARLEAILDAAWQGRGQLAVIVGAAGIGKSRLAVEAMAAAARRGGRVLTGHCYETEKILPLAPWLYVFRAGEVAADATLMAGLEPAWRVELARLLPEIAAAESPAVAGDTARTFEAIATVLHRLGRTQPLLVVLEDVQWADELSIRLIVYLARRVVAWPVVLLVTVRIEDLREDPLLRRARDEVRRSGHGVELRIGALSQDGTGRLARALLGPGHRRDAAEDLDARIWRATEGNPFMVVETVRALRAGGSLGAEGGLPLPAGVRALVRSHLAPLSPAVRRLVEAAAVIGRQFDFDLLCRASRIGEEDAAVAVEELVRREIFRQAGDGFEFSHDRIREVVRADVLAPRRAVLHRQIAAALEDRDGAHDESALAIGTHYLEGGAWPQAARFLARAGAAASRQGAATDAARSYEHALDALARVPEGPGAQEQTFELHLLAAYERYQLGDPPTAVDHLRRGEVAMRALGNDRRMAHLAGALTYTLCMGGRYQEAVETGTRAVAAAQAVDDPRLEAYASTGLSMVHYALGQYPQSLERAKVALGILATRATGAAGVVIGIPPEVGARVWTTMSLARMGNFLEAGACGERAVAMAERLGDHRSRVSAYLCLGTTMLAKGDVDDAVPLFEAALDLCEGRPQAWYAPRVLADVAFAYAMRGDLPRAIPLLERAVDDAAASGVVVDRTRALNYMGAALLWAGRVDDAQTTAEQALAQSRLRGERGDEAWALEVLGEVAIESGAASPDAAVAHFEAALALAEQLGMRSLRGRCHLGLGRAHARAGRAAEARLAFARAAEDFQALGMTSWLARTTAAART
jgi:DNA-binding SARP family transcriptional activator